MISLQNRHATCNLRFLRNGPDWRTAPADGKRRHLTERQRFSSGVQSAVGAMGLESVCNPSKHLLHKGLTNAGYLDILSSGKELI